MAFHGLPPPRGRTPSGHDVPIPEAVFVALHGIQGDVRALAQTMAVGQAATDQKISDIGTDVPALKAADRAHLAKIVGIVATAVASVIGGQRMLAPTPPAPEVRAVRSAADLALDECRPLAPGSYERAECFERVSRVDPRGRLR
jgi:hypothetical protein